VSSLVSRVIARCRWTTDHADPCAGFAGVPHVDPCDPDARRSTAPP
jgi:hypothetical protein